MYFIINCLPLKAAINRCQNLEGELMEGKLYFRLSHFLKNEYDYDWFMLMYSRNHHNIEKQLSSNLKKKNKRKGKSNKQAALCRSQTAAWKWRYNFTWVTKQYLAWQRSCQYCLQVVRSTLTFMFRKMMMPCTCRQGSPWCDDDWHLKGTVLIHNHLRKTFKWPIPLPHVSVVASVSQGGWVSLVPEVGSDSDDSGPLSLGLVL